MTDYFGYQPSAMPSSGSQFDHYGTSEVVEYTPTNWDNVDIVKMWMMIQNQSDERAFAVADMWRRTAALLQATRDHLYRHAQVLAGKWTSDAGKYFLNQVGATLASLDEWHDVAKRHQEGLQQVANAIQTAQQKFPPLWERYQARERDQQSERDNGFLKNTFTLNWDGAESFDDVKRQFHEEAKNITKPLADAFFDVSVNSLYTSGRFKGPTNAVVTDRSSIPRGGPTRPGGGPARPRVGAPPPPPPRLAQRPGMPNSTDVPTAPPPPPLPDGVQLAGGVGVPTAPPPTAPTLPTTPAVNPPPSTPMLPSAPSNLAGNRAASPPSRPNLPGGGGGSGPGSGPGQGSRRGPAPGRPTLPGSQGPGGPRTGAPPAGRRGAPPSKPTLPGNTGGPSGMRPPGLGSKSAGKGGPATPRLPGSTAGPGAGGTPGRPATPQLPGRGAAATPGKPGAPATPGRGTPGAGQAPETPSTRPNLTGRGTGTNRPGGPTTGPDPSLGGRRGEPARAERDTERRPAEQERDTWVYVEGDGLWATESEAVAAVEAPAEHQPQQQGKALGQG